MILPWPKLARAAGIPYLVAAALTWCKKTTTTMNEWINYKGTSAHHNHTGVTMSVDAFSTG
jgi:hypothetical protein